MHTAMIPAMVEPHRDPFRGAVMMVAGCAAVTLNDACMKALVAAHPVAQVVSMRAFVGLGIMLMFSAWLGGVRSFVPRQPKTAAILTALLVFGLFMFPLSLAYIPLADAIMLAYLSPVLVAVMSPFLLAERMGWRRWAAVAMGLVGAALVIRPEGGDWQAAVLIPVAVAGAIAIRDILTRRHINGENTYALVAMAHVAAGVLGLFSLSRGWAWFTLTEWLLLGLAAILLTVAQVLMVASFRHAEATVLSCLKYTSILWAAALGWMFFGEVQTVFDWIGAIMIVGSGIVILQRQKLHDQVEPTSGAGTKEDTP